MCSFAKIEQMSSSTFVVLCCHPYLPTKSPCCGRTSCITSSSTPESGGQGQVIFIRHIFNNRIERKGDEQATTALALDYDHTDRNTRSLSKGANFLFIHDPPDGR